MKKPKHWFDKTYKMNFYIYYGWKVENYRQHLLQTFGVDKKDFGAGHSMINFEKSIITIWVKNKNDIGVVAHECFHASNFVFRARGIQQSLTNDEPQAYYIERLVKEVTGAK